MKLDSFGRITWHIDSQTALEPDFLYRDRNRARESFHGTGGAVARGDDSDAYGSQPSNSQDVAESTSRPLVLIPVDFSSASPTASRVGLSVARYTNASVLLCHAVFPNIIRFGPSFPNWLADALQSEALEKMSPFLNAASQSGVKANSVVDLGTPAGVILKTARTYDANLIVLTTRGRSSWARLLFGPTIAEQVAQEADCHVMIVRSI